MAFFLSCNRAKTVHRHGFYYWKTTAGAVDIGEKSEVAKLGVKQFYVRFLDVDWSDHRSMPVPAGQLRWDTVNVPVFSASDIIPVVFITNHTFREIDDEWCNTLAHKLSDKLEWMLKVHQLTCSQIQIDCDWTESTRDKYFLFLKIFKARNVGKIISATIRLYPYKYSQKMGVPPVDRGMLMCYNLGRVNLETTRNSIFDVGELKQYLSKEKFPLPLDVALPVFSWYVWFRDGQYKGIVHNDTLIKDSSIFKTVGPKNLKVAQDVVIEDLYLRAGDELRLEKPEDKDIETAMNQITNCLGDYGSISFFDWNYQSIQQHEKAIEKIFDHY